MNQIMSCIPVGSGWYIQVLLPDGKLQWVPCVGGFQEAMDHAVRWEPEKGEAT